MAAAVVEVVEVAVVVGVADVGSRVEVVERAVVVVADGSPAAALDDVVVGGAARVTAEPTAELEAEVPCICTIVEPDPVLVAVIVGDAGAAVAPASAAAAAEPWRPVEVGCWGVAAGVGAAEARGGTSLSGRRC